MNEPMQHFVFRAAALRTMAVFCGVLSLALGAGAAEEIQTLASRRFAAAKALEGAGQLAEAVDAYRQVVDGHPESPRADDALLALARLAWPVTAAREAATREIAPEAIRSARDALETLRSAYPGADSAAEGLWRLALVHLVPSPLFFDLDRSAALLTTLPSLYPDAPRVPEARALAASLHALRGRLDVATRLAFDVVSQTPSHPAAAEAWSVLGRAAFAEGDVGRALVAFNRAAETAREHGANETAREAVGLATILDRAAFAKDRSRTLFAPSAHDRRIALPGRATTLHAAADGRLWIHMPRKDAVTVFTKEGHQLALRDVGPAAAIAVDRWNRLWMAHEEELSSPTGPVRLPQKTSVAAFVPVGPASAWILDRQARAVTRVDAGAGAVARVVLPERATPRLLAVAAGDGVWVVTERPALLRRVDGEGKTTLDVGLESLMGRTIGLVTDALGYVYLLDDKPAAIVVLAPNGSFVDRVPIDPDATGTSRPTAIAVDGAGHVAIYDDRARSVTWFD